MVVISTQQLRENASSQKLTFNMKKLSVTLNANDMDTLARIAINELNAKLLIQEDESMKASVINMFWKHFHRFFGREH